MCWKGNLFADFEKAASPMEINITVTTVLKMRKVKLCRPQNIHLWNWGEVVLIPISLQSPAAKSFPVCLERKFLTPQMEWEATLTGQSMPSRLTLSKSQRKRGAIPIWPFPSGFFSPNMEHTERFIKKKLAGGSITGVRFLLLSTVSGLSHTNTLWQIRFGDRNGLQAAHHFITYLPRKAAWVKMMKTLSDKSAKCKVAEIEWDCSWENPSIVIYSLETL